MKHLHISDTLSLPQEAVSRTFGLLAVRGAGKSNAAAVMAEEMFDAHLPFVAIDPVGSFWGLRSSADGTGPGLPIPIFGGKHGDLPLERGAGELVADLIVGKRLSCVIDLSNFESESAKKAFLLAFARRLYLKNEDPLHLFLEEADDYIPQKPMRDEAELLRAWENIVRRGRSRGLGITLITQRSAAINKMVLTQVETLFAMRTSGPQDIASIEAWIKYHQVGQEVLSTLASLEDGDAWVWSPHFLKTIKRIHFRQRRTFDSGATPKNLTGKTSRPPATLADVNLSELQTQMAATIEKSKAEDPKELQKQILSLKKEIVALKQQKPEAAKTEHVEVSVLTDEDRKLLQGAAQVLIVLKTDLQTMAEIADKIYTVCEKAGVSNNNPVKTPFKSNLNQTKSQLKPPRQPQESRPVAHSSGPSNLTGPEQRILDAIAWMESIGVDTPEQTAVAFLAGYTYGGGGFNNPRGALRTKGLLEYVAGDKIRLTPEGRGLANMPEGALTTAELHRAVLDRLPGPEQKILTVILRAYPHSLSNETCANAAGYTAGAGGYNNPRGRLRTLGLIEYPEGGTVRARDILFLD